MNSLLLKLRTTIFKPDSEFELILRSLYHKFSASRFGFYLQHWRSKRSYHAWKKKQISKETSIIEKPNNLPSISFLLNWPAGETQKVLLTLESLRNVKGENWEVLLIAPESDSFTKLPDYLTQDTRIQLISQNQHFNFRSVNGDYLVFCQAGDQFFKPLLTHLYGQIEKGISADIFYYDCEYQKDPSLSPHPFFKPSTPSPALLLSVNYLSRAFFSRTAVLEVMDDINPELSILGHEYELTFRLIEKGNMIQHIPAVLVSQTDLAKPDNPEARKIVTDHLSRLGLENVNYSTTTSGTRFTWASGNATTAIVIPTKNNRPLLAALIDSIFNHTHNTDFSIHIVDNGSDDPSTLNYYKTISQDPNISIIDYDAPFNYSEAINLGVAKSESDLILILNDDMQIIDDSWLSELTQWAIQPEIGIVGAKLLRANRTIQHAGIIIGLNGFAGHIYLNAPEHYQGLFGSADWYRDYLAVTGACQMMRREVFYEAGGYDEGYHLAFGDINFCLRVHQLGYRNIFTPFTRLFHYEGQSRGYITPKQDVLKGLEDMSTYLETGDPNFSPNLTYTRIPKCAPQKQTQQSRMEQIDIRKQFYLKE